MEALNNLENSPKAVEYEDPWEVAEETLAELESEGLTPEKIAELAELGSDRFVPADEFFASLEA